MLLDCPLLPSPSKVVQEWEDLIHFEVFLIQGVGGDGWDWCPELQCAFQSV